MQLEAVRIFCAVAEAGSFTAGARRLGIDKSHASRAVKTLEEELGSALFVRTTRSVRLTNEGEALLRRAAPALAELERAVANVPAPAAGEVSLTTTEDIGRGLLAPALASFRVQWPTIRVRVTLGADVVDLVRERVDLALRVGKPRGDALVARKLTSLELGFYAAPAYLARRGAPASLAALDDHETCWPIPTRETRSFRRGARPPSPTVASSDFGFLAELARLGGGIALLPTFLAARDAGALVRVLPSASFGAEPLYLVRRAMRPVPPRIEALWAHLVACMGRAG